MEKPRKGEPCINFLVENIDDAYKSLQQKGVKVIEGPKETLWGSRILLFEDPDGNILQLTEIDWRKYFKACAPK